MESVRYHTEQTKEPCANCGRADYKGFGIRVNGSVQLCGEQCRKDYLYLQQQDKVREGDYTD